MGWVKQNDLLRERAESAYGTADVVTVGQSSAAEKFSRSVSQSEKSVGGWEEIEMQRYFGIYRAVFGERHHVWGTKEVHKDGQ